MPMSLHCPNLGCYSTMSEVLPGLHFECPRCGSKVQLPDPAQAIRVRLARIREARSLAERFPSLKVAFDGWNSGDAYWSSAGKSNVFRLKSRKGRVAEWSKIARKFYPDLGSFVNAAKAFTADKAEAVSRA